MKKWSIYSIVTVSVILIGINLYLIEKKNSKINRIHYVTKWDSVKNESLSTSFTTDGVVAPSEKHFVYVNPESGFNEFLVKVGDKVEVGTPLFNYSTNDIDKKKNILDTEIERLQKEIASIDHHIQSLTALQAATGTENLVQENQEEFNEATNQLEWSYSLDLEISKSELEKEKLEQQIEQYESQKLAYDGETSALTIVSGQSGVIKQISYSLENPIITIVSTTPVIKASLSEKQRALVEDGMNTIITSNLFKGRITGELENIASSPEADTKVEKSSNYPVTISLNEHVQKLIEGYHVNASIITQEVKNAKTVKESSVESNHNKHWLWCLNKNGELEKQPLQLGINTSGKQEVKGNIKEGTLYITKPNHYHHEGPFFTPLKTSQIQKQTLKDVGAKSALKYIAIGILQK